MKFQTMLDLRSRSEIILNATNVGFDFPEMSTALEETKDRLADEDIETIRSEVKVIIDKLEEPDQLALLGMIINNKLGEQDLNDLVSWLFERFISKFEGQDLGDCIDWLFEKDNIQSTDAFFESVIKFYEMVAEMYLDEVSPANTPVE